MRIKYSLVITMVLFLVFIGAAYASDVNQTSDSTLTSDIDSVEQISIENQEELSADGDSFSDLQDEINSKDNVDLEKNYTFNETKDNAIMISKEMTIDGKGYTIDANGKSNIFIVNSTGVTLKNLIFLNVNTTNGAAVVFDNTANAVLENCKFINTAGDCGSVEFTGGNLTIINCEFINSVCQDIYVSSSESVTLKDVTLSNSIGVGYTIEINAEKNINVENLIIENITPFVFSSVDGSGIWDNTTSENAFGLLFNSNVGNVNLNGIKVNNVKSAYHDKFLEVRGNNVTVEDLAVTNSAFGSESETSLIISSNENLIVNGWDFDNISRAVGINHTYFNQEHEKYVYDYQDTREAFNIELYASNITISDFSIKNSVAGGEGFLFDFSADNITVDNLNLVNISIDTVKDINYDSYYDMELIQSETAEQSTFMGMYAGNLVNLHNINIDNFTDIDTKFMEIIGYDVYVGDVTIANSPLAGGENEGILIRASNNVNIDNFIVNNLTQAIGHNSSYFDASYEKYIWNYYLEGDEGGFELHIDATNTTTLTNVAFTNVQGGGYEALIYVNSDSIVADSILIENITSPFTHIRWEYNQYLDDYVYSMNTAESSSAGLKFLGQNGMVNISNIKVNNAVSRSYDMFFEATGGNVTIDNVEVLNSKVSGGEGEGFYISALYDAKINNFVLDNLSEALGSNQTEYYIDYGKYVWEYRSMSEGGPVGVTVMAQNSIEMYDVNITNIKDAGYRILNLESSYITAENIVLENITPYEYIEYEYNPYLDEYLVTKNNQEGQSSIRILGDDNVDLKDIKISNLTTSDKFLYIEGEDVTIENFDVKDSFISVDSEGCYIHAYNLNVTNFKADNISPAPGYNNSYYDSSYGKYIYDYQSRYGGFGLYIDAEDSVLDNLTFTNIMGGNYDGTLTVYSDYLVANNIFIENISTPYNVEIRYEPDYARHICLQNYSGEGGGGLSVDAKEIILTNVVVNNIDAVGEESYIFMVRSENNITIENVTVSNVIPIGYFSSSWDYSTNQYLSERYFEAEELMEIYAQNNLNITNMIVDNIPIFEETFEIRGMNVTVTNSTFKNMHTHDIRQIETDPYLRKEVVVYQSNEGMGVYFDGDNVMLSGVTFENITMGGGEYGECGAAIINSYNNALVENCTFVDIGMLPYYYYYNRYGYVSNETGPSYGGAIFIYSGNNSNITDSSFIRCSAEYGGAIYAINPLNITGSEFINCSAKWGGAIYIDGSGLFINNTNFTQNSAILGGALYFTEDSFNNTVYNATFLKNLAEENGGALYIFESTENGLNLINASQFYLNHADYNGGAFYFNDTINCILWDDYRWHNATASSKIHYDLTFISQPLERTMIVFSKFEDNTDYPLAIIARNNAVGGNHTVTISINDVATGYVYVNITDMDGNFIKDKQGNEINGYYLLENGKVVFELEDLPIGDYNVSANYSDWEYNQHILYYHENTTIFTIYPHDLNVTANKTVFPDENVTVVAKLNNMTTGTVNITISNSTVNLTFSEIPVVNGTVEFNYTGLWAGDYNVTVTYNGDEIFYPKSNSTSFTVIQRDSNVSVSVKDNVYGNTTKIIVEVPQNQTGNVTVKINNHTFTKEVTNGTVVFEVDNLTAGEWEANVTFEENRIYKENNTIFKFEVLKANLTAEVIGNNVTVKDNASFIINVPEDFKGNVTIEIDGKTYYDGPVSDLINITSFPAGNYTADVKFYGDNNYNDAEVEAPFNVAAVEPEITVNITDTYYGGNATATVKVSGNANGTVNIIVDGKTYTGTVSNGTATVQLDNLTAGDKVAEVKFITSDRYNLNATTEASFNVAKINSTIVISNDEDDLIIELPKNATGNITVFVGADQYSREIINGTVRLDDILPAGETPVVAFYDGDNNYFGSRNSTKVLYNLDSIVNATATDSIYGETSFVTVYVPIKQTGYVLITVANVTYANLIKNGMAVFNVTGLDVGEYKVDVLYLGDKIYGNSTNVTYFNVTKADLKAVVEGLNVSISDNATFVLHNVPSDFKGKVNITVDGQTYVRDVDSLVEIAKLTAGNKTAQVLFYGDNNYNDLLLDANFTISRFADYVNVTIEDITYGETAVANITVTGNPNGTVTVTVDGKTFNGTVKEGKAIVNLTDLSAGSKIAIVKFTTYDDDFTNATTTEKFTVRKANSTVSVVVDGVDVIATVNEGATGNVTFHINGREETVKLNGTKAVLENALKIGFNDIVVIYEGDVNYTDSINSTNYTVPKKDSLVNATAENTVYGNPVIITVNVPVNQTGSVTIVVNNTNHTELIRDGKAIFNIAGLNVGEYDVAVFYLGDENYKNQTNVTSFNVTKADLNIRVDALNVSVMQNASFVLHNVPGDFKGKVNITVDGETYVREIDSVDEIAKLTAGDKTAHVVFYGDNNYNNLELDVNFTVSRVSAVINVTIEDITYGETAVAEINVSNNANGTVTITIDGKTFNGTVKNGIASVNLAGLSGGIKNAAVEFTTGDYYNTNATATDKFTVRKANSTVSVVVDGVDVIATVNEGATGNVTFYINGKEKTVKLNGNKAVLENALNVGFNDIVVIYEGDVNYTESRNTTNHTVSKKDSLVNASAENVVYGNPVIITVNVPVSQTGIVTIVVNNTNHTEEIRDGKAIFNIAGLNVGEYDVNVFYPGDVNYHNQTNVTSFNVTKADLNAVVVAQNVTFAEDTAFIISVHEDFKGKVNITVGSASYAGDVSSLISLGKLPAGNYTAEVAFYGDNNYKDETHTVKFTVSAYLPANITTINADNMKRGYNSPYDYQAAFLDIEGNALINSTVKFIVNGKEYSASTDESGIAQLTGSKLPVGKYNVTIVNAMFNEQVTRELEIVKRITENKDLTMDFNDGSNFVVKVWGDDGNIAPEGEIIDIYVNGVHYVCKVDKKGYASLKINLAPKKYKIRAEYEGFTTTNNLNVKHVLKAVKKTVTVKKGKKITIKAKLKWSNGKPIKGKKIAFKFKGKTYKAKTNKKGIAKVVIKNKKVLKILKKGKKYPVRITYAVKIKYGVSYAVVKDVVKCKVKIK